MYNIASSSATIALSLSDIGYLVALAVGAIVTGSVALFGLGFGIHKLAQWIFNEPNSWGYNSKYGSGLSRFNRAKTEEDGGGHMKSVRF